MGLKKCVICSTAFGSRRSNARYCSEDCRKEGQQMQRKSWEKNNPDYMKNYMQAYRQKK